MFAVRPNLSSKREQTTANLADEKLAGFYTQEISERSVRRDFRWKSLDGAIGTLAHVDIKGTWRMGKYGVGVALQPIRMNIAIIKMAGYTIRSLVFTMRFSLKSKCFDD
jgi:nucleoside-triphosphatase THEP1